MIATRIVKKDPQDIEEVKQLEDWPDWDTSIKKELDQHERIGTWSLVEPPKGTNIIGSKIVFHYKHDSDGNIASRKLRLVAQCFSQTEGIDYSETFAPTAKLSATNHYCSSCSE